MTKKDQIKDILKCVTKNYIMCFIMTSTIMMLVAGIQTGVLLGLLFEVFLIYIGVEIIYWLLTHTYRFIKGKLKRKEGVHNEN